MNRVYVDTEYAYPGMTSTSGRPTPANLREIVQIAAIQVDPKTGRELAHFDMLVTPSFVTPTPTFFFELTGITAEEIDARGVPFHEALAQFVEFCQKAEVWTFNADWGVFKQNCELYGISFPFADMPFLRVCTMLDDWGVDDPTAYSSGTLYKAAGLEMEGQVHNALHDVRSMSAAVHVFENQ